MHERSQRRVAGDLDALREATPAQTLSGPAATPLSARRDRSRRVWNAIRAQHPVRATGALAVFALVAAIVLMAGWLRPAFYEREAGVAADLRCAPGTGARMALDFCTVVEMDATRATLPGLSARNARMPLLRAIGAMLQHADFAYADLSGAVLVGADLRDARLVGARLARADLRHADLRGADLRYAELSGARVAGARLDDAVFEGAIGPDGRVCAASAAPSTCLGDVSSSRQP